MLAARACSLATSACRMDNLTNPMNDPAEGESSPDFPMLHKPAPARIDTWITLAHRLSHTHRPVIHLTLMSQKTDKLVLKNMECSWHHLLSNSFFLHTSVGHAVCGLFRGRYRSLEVV